MRKAVCALLCLALLAVSGAAPALDVSRENGQPERLKKSNLMTFKTNAYTEDRPLIIFFPGSKECSDLAGAMRFIRNYHLYNDIEADLIVVTIKTGGIRPRDWEAPSRDVLDFVREKYGDKRPEIVVDAVSFGGYGGCFLAQLFGENGFPVRELNLADGTIPNSVTGDWIRALAASGIRVNLWGCYGHINVSREGRRLAEELEGTENFRATLLKCSHGQVLHFAIWENGLHAEYRKKEEP